MCCQEDPAKKNISIVCNPEFNDEVVPVKPLKFKINKKFTDQELSENQDTRCPYLKTLWTQWKSQKIEKQRKLGIF